MAILTIILPIFLLIGLGYACAWRRLLTPDQVRGLGRFVIVIALPALLFRSLVQQDLRDVLEWRYFLVYAGASIGALAAGIGYARAVHGLALTQATMRGFGMAMSNSGFIGFPLAIQLLGPRAAIPLALTFIVENLVILPLVLALAESGQGQQGSAGATARKIGRSLISSPLILAILAACIGMLLGLHPAGPLAKMIDMLAAASAPVALVAIGATLFGLSARGMVRPVLEVAAGKLLLHPLLVIALLAVVPLTDPTLRHAAILLACVPMFGTYPIIAQRFGEEKFTSAALLVTTALAFVTLSLWASALQAGWLG